MPVRHPCSELPQALVEKIVGRRGRLHAFERLVPARTALVVIDLDADSSSREPELSAAAIVRVNSIARRLRRAGGAVAFVTSIIGDPAGLARRLIDDQAPF